MSDITYAVSFSEMSAAVAAAGALAQKVQGTLEAMDAETRSRLSSWTGDAQAAYIASYTQAKAVADQMPNTLAQARDTLRQISENYSTAETRVAGAFGA